LGARSKLYPHKQEVLQEYHNGTTFKEIGKRFGVRPTTVRNFVYKFVDKKNRRVDLRHQKGEHSTRNKSKTLWCNEWSETEKQFIIQNAGKMKDGEVAAALTRITGRTISLQAVRKQRQKLGIVKRPGRGLCSLKQDEAET
jgi:transposase